jgi:hypothetical protein
MFDPQINATYAARFLLSLYGETGSWEAAAGAYHSRTPEFAQKYAARFSRFHRELAGETADDIPEIPDIVLAAYGTDALPPARTNTYPLLQAGGGAALGSLVPVANSVGNVLFGTIDADVD